MTDMKGPPSIIPDKGPLSVIPDKDPPSVLPTKEPPSVIPDVSNRESRVFPGWTLPSLTVRHHGSPHSEVMLPLPEGYDSRLNSRESLF